MSDSTRIPSAWSARGLLFENCSCTTVCPGHVHFDQNCTFERCVGYWAIVFEDGDFGGVPLAGVAAVVAYDCPQHMIEGDWTQGVIIDVAATVDQRRAVETILAGQAGGPWGKLAPFVGRLLSTRYLPIRIEDLGRKKTLSISGLLDSTIEAIRGRDRGKPVTFENMFNQIHAPSQVIATGATNYDDGEIVISTRGTHALYSRFNWSVGEAR